MLQVVFLLISVFVILAVRLVPFDLNAEVEVVLSGELPWNGSLLEGDLEDSIPRLKEAVDGDLFVHGSGEFAYALAEKGLVDLYEVYVNPVVWGEANLHVLGDRGRIPLELTTVRKFDSGVVLLTYLPL